jgi:hypothetical protein
LSTNERAATETDSKRWTKQAGPKEEEEKEKKNIGG